MKIYVVAHENIIIPEEYSKVEIEKEEVVHYIKKSEAYQDMLENLEEEFYEIGYYDLGDFYLALER